MKILRVGPLLLALATLLASCNKDEDLSGTYLGVAQFTIAGIRLDVEIRTTLSHSGSSLSGTFTGRQLIPGGSTATGSVTGTVNGSAVTLDFMPSNPSDCPGRLAATSGMNRFTGTLTLTCGVPASAPLELVKQ